MDSIPRMVSSASDLVAVAAACRSVVMVGGMDTGKSTLARRLARSALESGRSVAYVDADIGNSTVGPPTCVGLKVIRAAAEVDSLDPPDRLHFVGGISPDRLVLQQVVATVALAEEAKRLAHLAIVDTTGAISGVGGETLKYHKVELIRPDLVVALQRGGELEPIIGMLRRFLSAEVVSLPAEPDVVPIGPEDRAARRAEQLKRAFAPPLERWRVRPTVFAPTLPAGLDLSRLDGVLVGIQDGSGRCLGLGRLEHQEGVLRVVTNAGEGMQGLRLGSLRVDLESFSTRPVNLSELIFGV